MDIQSVRVDSMGIDFVIEYPEQEHPKLSFHAWKLLFESATYDLGIQSNALADFIAKPIKC